MNFSKIGIALIVLLLAATSIVLIRTESELRRPQIAQQRPAAQQTSTAEQPAQGASESELKSALGLRPELRSRAAQTAENERRVTLDPGDSTLISANEPTRVFCRSEGELGEAVPANTTVWVCDCQMREGDDVAYLVRKLITTAGKTVHETVLERFSSEFTDEYKMTACLEMLKQSPLCR